MKGLCAEEAMLAARQTAGRISRIRFSILVVSLALIGSTPICVFALRGASPALPGISLFCHSISWVFGIAQWKINALKNLYPARPFVRNRERYPKIEHR